jgi:hypothetical protein
MSRKTGRLDRHMRLSLQRRRKKERSGSLKTTSTVNKVRETTPEKNNGTQSKSDPAKP